jgi:hypothetical protein
MPDPTEKQPRFVIRVSAPNVLSSKLNWNEIGSIAHWGKDALSLIETELAALVMQMVATMTYADQGWAKVLTRLLDAEWSVVVAMWDSVRGTTAQNAMLAGAAQKRLSTEDQKLFFAVRAAIDPVRDRRNSYVHKLWAHTPKIPDALCLIDPKASLSDHVIRRERYRASRSGHDAFSLSLLEMLEEHTTGGGMVVDDALKQVHVFSKDHVERDLQAALEANRLVYLLGILAARDERGDQARKELSAALTPLGHGQNAGAHAE